MRVRVRVPATSANLGPGFDALGLALGLHNEVILEEADGIVVTVEGEGAGRLDDDAKNVVARGVALGFEVAGRPLSIIGGDPRCRSAIDFRGSRGGLELDFYCRVCREHVHLPEHALSRVGSDPDAGERPAAMKASSR